ncbi:hypothetical protein V2J09_016085 [Rumex salicifolius]
MDPKINTSESGDTNENDTQLAIAGPPPKPMLPPTASISLSLSAILPSNLTNPASKLPRVFSAVKFSSSKISSSLVHLSLSSPTLSPHKSFSKKSSFSAIPLQSPLSVNPRRPSDPSNGAAIRRSTIVWFRSDLRVHDNECLNSASNESMSVLPVYCFDPRDYGKSSSGFDKTGPNRASFLIEAVADLRKSLQARGSDLVVRIGKPETVLVELAKSIGADAVYAHREVSKEEVKSELKIENAMKDEGIEVKYFWGSTLYHMEDLPFKLENMPTNYGGFREKVKGLKVRDTVAALDRLKGLPSRGDVERGEIPSLVRLGVNPNASLAQDGKPVANAPMVGGETEALQRVKKFAAECQAQPHKGSKDGSDSIYGANFSCKISPWLTTGSLSPRSMFEELKKTASRTISASSKGKDDGDGMSWLTSELLWRDFFRFITKKYSSAVKLDTAPATACTGALA